MNRLYCFIILTSSCINASVLTPTNTIPVFVYCTYYNSCCTIPIQRSILHSISIQAISYGTHAHLKETYEPNLFLHQKNRLLQRCIKTIHGSRHKLHGIKLTLPNLHSHPSIFFIFPGSDFQNTITTDSTCSVLLVMHCHKRHQ